MAIDWPPELDRTPADERSSTSNFQASLGQTTGELERELDRLEVDHFRAEIGNQHTKSNGLPLHNARPDDPGFVLRWTKDGEDFAIGCDAYTRLRDNVREIFLWMRETRLSGDRPVVTGQSQFAAAALPPGDPEAVAMPARSQEPPHEVLGIDPGSPDDVVEAVGRRLKARYHPDSGAEPDQDRFIQVNKAEEALLDE